MQATNTYQAGTEISSSPPWLTLWKDSSAAVASTMTAIGLLAAGIYSLWIYRNRFPRAKVTHQVLDWNAGDKRMVRGVVRVENIGNVMIQVRSLRGVLTQIIPLPSDVSKAVAARRDPVDRDSTEVVWETLGDRKKDFSKEGCEIEPGEADEFFFDFVIEPDVRKVQFYSHIENVKKFKRNIGWNTTLIYDVSNGKENIISDRSGSTKGCKGPPASTSEEESVAPHGDSPGTAEGREGHCGKAGHTEGG